MMQTEMQSRTPSKPILLETVCHGRQARSRSDLHNANESVAVSKIDLYF